MTPRVRVAVFFTTFTILSAAANAAEFFPEEPQPLGADEISALVADSLSPTAAGEEESIQVGDMLFFISDLATQGFSAPPWPNGRLIFQFADNVNNWQRGRFWEACAMWSAVAAVDCVERVNEPGYVVVSSGNGNSAHVGYTGKRQSLTMFNWENVIIIVHELGHAFGMSHEHQRSDRDNFVSVYEPNICGGASINFDKRNTQNYNEFDFCSAMMYGPLYFSCNGLPTLLPREGYEHRRDCMGQRQRITALDAGGMSRRYGAPK